MFGLCVFVFVEVVMVDLFLCVDEVVCGLVFVVECVLDCIVVVDCDWVVDVEVVYGFFDVIDVVFECEFWCVYVDYDEFVWCVFVCLGGCVW